MARAAAALLIASGALLLFVSTQASAASAGDGNAPDNPDAGVGDWPGIDLASVFLDQAVGAVTMQTGQMTMSAAGLAMLENLEGFSATPYPDHKGQSIGYGHLIKPGEDLTYVTQMQAAELLAQDVASAESTVNACVSVPLTQGQFDALVSFTYNVGAGSFRGSTLLRKLNAGDYTGAAAEFPRWVNASGQVNASLVARRDQEQSLFEA